MSTLCGGKSVLNGPTLDREDANERDIKDQVALEKQDDSPGSPTSSPRSNSPEQIVISFATDDPDDPHCWSKKRKVWVVLVGIAMVMSSTIGSSIASGATEAISNDFHNYNQAQLVLPTSIYLVGYVLGPLAFGPLSESFGRKPVMIGTFVCFKPCLCDTKILDR